MEIAGLVHQACPDADILAWRVVPSQGPIVESELVVSLAQIAELARLYRALTSRARELVDQPEIRSTLTATMGNVYRGLGLYGRAEELIDRGRVRVDGVVGDLHPR